MKAKILLAGILAIGMCACSTDDNLEGTSGLTSNGEKVYMQFKLQLPTTRSATTSGEENDYVKSNDGIEYGQDYENQVNKVTLALAKDDQIILVTTADVYESTKDLYVATVETNEISSYYGQTVEVYVYCNSDANPENDTDGLDAVYKLGENDTKPWTNGGFYMSSAKPAFKALPSLDEVSTIYNEANPIDLGTVDVERSVARFDYKDGSPNTTDNNTYNIIDGESNTSITLTEIALVNMSNEFYYLRRVSEEGKSTSNDWEICGTEWYTAATENSEGKGNYVVDTDWGYKSDYTGGSESEHFIYPYVGATVSSLDWTTLSSLTNEDNNDSWNNSGNYGDYYIWRYATENTIPAGTENQKKGITTGVAFKGQINIDDYEDLGIDATTEDSTIYVFENVLYGTWDKIKSIVEAETDDSQHSSLYAAYYEAETLKATEDEEGNSVYTAKEALEIAHFTGYSPDSDGNYYTYYYYWNRHNDNGENNVMGIMEFDVVRNNVYKLSVTGINKFGHPAPGSDDPDPDPEDPGDPDEDDTIAIVVEVHILPWVVRVNDITF